MSLGVKDLGKNWPVPSGFLVGSLPPIWLIYCNLYKEEYWWISWRKNDIGKKSYCHSRTQKTPPKQNSVCFLKSEESFWHNKMCFIVLGPQFTRTKAHSGAVRWWWWVCLYVGRGVMAPLVKGCEWMWLLCRACSALRFIPSDCSCWCCWPQILWPALVLLHSPPSNPTISWSLDLPQAPKSPVSSCLTLRGLTLTCHCHFSHLAPHPSSFILLALLSLHLADLSSMSPLMEDSLPDSTSVSNIISPCNLSLARRGVTWHNALVDGVNFWHLFYGTGKDLNRNLSAAPGFFLLQQLSTWQTQLKYFFLSVLLFIVFCIVQIPQ